MNIHIWEIHDSSNVSTDHHDPDVAVGEPKRQHLPWYWGVRDGDQVPTTAFESFQHPPPPCVQERWNGREEEDRHDRARRDHIDDHPDFHDAFDANGHNDDDDRDHWPRNPRDHARSHDDGYGCGHDTTRGERSRSPRCQSQSSGTYGGCRREATIDDDTPMTPKELEARR